MHPERWSLLGMGKIRGYPSFCSDMVSLGTVMETRGVVFSMLMNL